MTRSMSSRVPVRTSHPGFARYCFKYPFMTFGVSCSGSMETEISCIFRVSAPSFPWRLVYPAESTGQMVVQVP